MTISTDDKALVLRAWAYFLETGKARDRRIAQILTDSALEGSIVGSTFPTCDEDYAAILRALYIEPDPTNGVEA